jgi:polar amino acid transport system permease protein
MRRIIPPQAARIIIPPLGNEFNNMLKTTSLLIAISVAELYVVFDIKNGILFHPFELFLAAAVWYLLLTTIWGLIQSRLERRFARGANTDQVDGPGFRDRLFGSGRVAVEAGGPNSGGR